MKHAKVDLNLLPLLDAILTQESVGKAAAQVGLSKPAASHALARIRAQLGDAILVRAGQRWVLTQRAAAIAPRVHAAVEEARLLLSADRPFDPKELRREFRVHATDAMLSLVGLQVGHAVSKEAPNVSLRFFPLEADEPSALRSDVDLSLGVFHDLPPELRTQTLFDDRFVCIASARHTTIRGELSLEAFMAARHVGVAPRGRPGSVVDSVLAARGLARRALRWVPYYANAIEFVAESDCIAIISERLARRAAQRYDLQLFAPPFELPSCSGMQMWHPRLDADPAHAWLRRLVFTTAQHEKRSRSKKA